MQLDAKSGRLSIVERVYRLREHVKVLRKQHYGQNNDHMTRVSSDIVKRPTGGDDSDPFSDWDWKRETYEGII